MIADAGEDAAEKRGHRRLKRRPGRQNLCRIWILGIAIAREEQKTLVVSTANVALQDQICYSKDLLLLRKIIPDLRFTAAFTGATFRFA